MRNATSKKVSFDQRAKNARKYEAKRGMLTSLSLDDKDGKAGNISMALRSTNPQTSRRVQIPDTDTRKTTKSVYLQEGDSFKSTEMDPIDPKYSKYCRKGGRLPYLTFLEINYTQEQEPCVGWRHTKSGLVREAAQMEKIIVPK